MNENQRGAVSEIFRKMPNKRWEGSYTQKVCSGLIRHPFSNLRAALRLLENYHDTMHVVYEERDLARAERDEALVHVNSLRAFNSYVQENRVQISKELLRVRQSEKELTEQVARLMSINQDFVRKVEDARREANEARDRLQVLRRKVAEAVLNNAGFKDCI